MKIIRTIAASLLLTLALIPVYSFAGDDLPEVIPEAAPVEADETEESGAELATDTDDTEAEDAESIPAPEESGEAPALQDEASEAGCWPQDNAPVETQQVPSKPAPYDVAVQRVREGNKYISLLDLGLPEGEADMLFDYLVSAGVICEGYDVTLLIENGVISGYMIIKTPPKEKHPESRKAKKSAQTGPDAGQEADPPLKPAAYTAPENAAKPASEDSPEQPFFSFISSLLLLIESVRRILF